MEAAPSARQPEEEGRSIRPRLHQRHSTHDRPSLSTRQVSFSTLQESEYNGHRPQHSPGRQSRGDTGSRWAYCSLWVWEALLLCVAVATMAVIVAILLRQDGRPVQDWTFPITLNSTANVLSTICRGIIVSIAAEIICQTKWVWYWSDKTASRRMIDLQHFDSGSRGLVRAAKLARIVLWHSPTTLLSVFLVVFSFAMGPFVQQAIKTVDIDRVDPQGRASIPVSTALSGRNGGAYILGTPDLREGGLEAGRLAPDVYYDFALHPTVRGVAYAATLGTYKGDSQIVPSCTTGNCSFTGFQSGTPQFDVGKEVTHASAGICNICTDVTSLTKSEAEPDNNNATSYELPNEMSLDSLHIIQVGNGDLSWAAAVMSPEALDASEIALVNVTVLARTLMKDGKRMNDDESGISVAVSCRIYTCLRSYSGNVLRGDLSETVTNTTPMYADLREREEEDPEEFIRPSVSAFVKLSWNYTGLQSPCRINAETYTVNNMSEGPDLVTMRHIRRAAAPEYPSIKVPRQCVYEFDNLWAYALAVFMKRELFRGECTVDYFVALGREEGEDLFPQCNGTDWISGFYDGGKATAESIEHRFSDFTNTFTNELRMGLVQSDDGVATGVAGQANHLVSFTSIEKQWLAFPIFMVVLEVFLLGWVIVRGWWRKDEEAIWKSSILPLLYYTNWFRGTVESGDAASQRLMTTREMEDGAEDIKVQFSRKGWRQHDDVSLEQMLPLERNS